MQVLMNKFSCAKEVYKIVIIRWSIGSVREASYPTASQPHRGESERGSVPSVTPEQPAVRLQSTPGAARWQGIVKIDEIKIPYISKPEISFSAIRPHLRQNLEALCSLIQYANKLVGLDDNALRSAAPGGAASQQGALGSSEDRRVAARGERGGSGPRRNDRAATCR